MSQNPLKELMNPKSIAIAGASNTLTKMGTQHILSIMNDGYQGKIYPIHPTDQTVVQLPAYKSVADLPEVPDLAFLVVPSDLILELLEDFGKKGTKYAVIITAGFKETGEDGIKKEARLKEISERYGIRFVGPNCIGIINTQARLNTVNLPWASSPGMLGLASQSGTYVTQVLTYLHNRGIRISKAVSVGNETNITLSDVLEYLGEDEDTKAIALYIEGLRDVQRFLDVARKITPHKPVVAQYIGGSEAGARSGMSHTGAMAGPDGMYDGLFKQAGIIRVDSVEDLYGHGWALATQPRIKGNRVGIITNSGGPGSAIANACEQGGMEVPLYSESLQEQIKPLVPAHAPKGNPVDLTFTMDPSLLAEQLPTLIMKSGEVDCVVIHGNMQSGYLKEKHRHLKSIIKISLEDLLERRKITSYEYAQLPQKLGIPMTVSTWFHRDDNYTEGYHNYNVPTYDAPEKAARAMVSLYRYKLITERKPYEKPVLPEKSAEAQKILDEAINNKQKALDECSAKRLLACYGIPVCTEELVTSKEEAARAALKIGFPVVVKVCRHDIMHKTESGMVFLNQKTPEEVAASFDAIQKTAGEGTPVLVSEMVKSEREFLAGIVRQEAFGTCVVFGLGGIFTEAFNDTTFRLAPLSASEAEEMIYSLKTKNMVQEFRGMPAIDPAKTAKLLQALSFVSVLHPEIKEIDMNPLMYRGADPVVVDSLIVLED